MGVDLAEKLLVCGGEAGALLQTPQWGRQDERDVAVADDVRGDCARARLQAPVRHPLEAHPRHVEGCRLFGVADVPVDMMVAFKLLEVAWGPCGREFWRPFRGDCDWCHFFSLLCE